MASAQSDIVVINEQGNTIEVQEEVSAAQDYGKGFDSDSDYESESNLHLDLNDDTFSQSCLVI